MLYDESTNVNKGTFMQARSTVFLKATIVLLSLVILLLCIFALPYAIHSQTYAIYRPILYGMYVPALPFFFASWQALKLLNYIDIEQVFSAASLDVLKHIKYCALVISGLYLLGLPYIIDVAVRHNKPGVAILGFVVIGASCAIATATAVFERLLQTAVDIKSENDLTV